MNNTQLEEESRFNALVATLWQRHDERLTRSPSTSMSALAVGFNYSSRRGQLASTAGCSTGQMRTRAWDGQEVVLFLPPQHNYQTPVCIYRGGGGRSPHSKKVLGSIPTSVFGRGLSTFLPRSKKCTSAWQKTLNQVWVNVRCPEMDQWPIQGGPAGIDSWQEPSGIWDF